MTDYTAHLAAARTPLLTGCGQPWQQWQAPAGAPDTVPPSTAPRPHRDEVRSCGACQRRAIPVAQPRTWYLLVCWGCDPEGKTPMPFETPAARGKWADRHRDSTGHDRWWCPDITEPLPDPTHGRIDPDIQAEVNEMNPRDVGQRVALENTLQEQRDRWSRP